MTSLDFAAACALFPHNTKNLPMTKVQASSDRIEHILQACVDGDISVLVNASHDELLNFACKSGCKALHWAAGSGNLELVQYLRERGMPVDLRAIRHSRDRTALHYACRNGHLDVAKYLVEQGADPNAFGKKQVTPLQLAVWQNRLEICQWLVIECKVDPLQLNEFQCGVVHWLGLVPKERAGANGIDLLPLAEWLAEFVDYSLVQKQGHSSLHKAAWGGHVELCRYLNREHGLFDEFPDAAGNYAVDLAAMAGHTDVVDFIRSHCSRDRLKSCNTLGIEVSESRDPDRVRKAYLALAKKLHPDSENGDSDQFNELVGAYHHLTVEEGKGMQMNSSHDRIPLLESPECEVEEREPKDDTPIHLHAVLREFGNNGIDLSNLKKKWRQVWPDVDFPDIGSMSLIEWARAQDGFEVKWVGTVPRLFATALDQSRNRSL